MPPSKPARRRKQSEPVVADVPLSFDSPESSNISAASFDPVDGLLIVSFKSGLVYGTRGVPMREWIDFYNADSKGKHFNGRIRPLFNLKPM